MLEPFSFHSTVEWNSSESCTIKVHNKVLVFASVVINTVIEMVVFLSASKFTTIVVCGGREWPERWGRTAYTCSSG